MMQVIRFPEKQNWQELIKRTSIESDFLEEKVAEILQQVRENGDQALEDFTFKFEGRRLDSLVVAEEDFREAETKVSAELKNAIAIAHRNIEKFHLSQVETPQIIETSKGVFCWRRAVPIEKVGLYVPAGTAPLFSTVLMLAVPARIAGCREIILCSPANKDGKIDPATLYAAKVCGINKIFKIGGAQAIAAMAFGTETVPKVYKIFGPGNQYVTEAKRQVSKFGTAIDMLAGPSEVAVLADETAIPAFVASDLLSQAEHGVDSQVILATVNESLIEETLKEIQRQIESLPRRQIAAQALDNSKAILFRDIETAIDFINQYAAEHLILALKNAELVATRITSAGSVFIGNYSCESAGDYASGTNHTLPTGGHAKISSGVSLDSFVKKITFQKLTPEGLSGLGKAIEVMAEAEGLMAHKMAVSIRLQNLGDTKQRTFRLEELVRENILRLKPYSSARKEFSGEAKVFLDANENSFGSPITPSYNRYPDPFQVKIKRELANIYDISTDQIFLGNGSDEAIDIAYRVFCYPGRDFAIVCPPTYGMYEVLADINDVRLKKIRLTDDFQLNLQSIKNEFCPNTKLLFICSPNNPTGNTFDSEHIIELITDFPGIVVVDEAYAEFSSKPSWIKEIKNHRNLIVLRTFSKAWGLAGLRVGLAFANEEIIELFNKVKPPYNISQISQEKIQEALSNRHKVGKMVSEIIEQREWLAEELKKIDIVEHVFPSEANFVLIKVRKARQIYDSLIKQGIVLRHRSDVNEDCLRITVGTKEENMILLEALRGVSV
jgi:histidinol dehydrogenase